MSGNEARLRARPAPAPGAARRRRALARHRRADDDRALSPGAGNRHQLRAGDLPAGVRRPAARAPSRSARSLLVGFVNVVLRVDDLFAGMLAEPGGARHAHAHPRPRRDRRACAGRSRTSTAFYRTPGAPRRDEPLALAEWRPRHVHDLRGRRPPLAARVRGRRRSCSPWLRPLPLLGAVCGAADLAAALRHPARRLAHPHRGARAGAAGHPRAAHPALVHPAADRGDPEPGVLQGRRRGATSAATAPSRATSAWRARSSSARPCSTWLPRELADRSSSFDARAARAPAAPRSTRRAIADARDGTVRDVIFNKATFVDAVGRGRGPGRA